MRLHLAKAILSIKNRAKSIILPDFKTHYKGMVIKQHSIGVKKDTQTRTGETDSDNTVHLQPIAFLTTHWEKNSLSNKWCWENWISTCSRMKLVSGLSPDKNIHSNWITDLHVRPEASKIKKRTWER
jgi:hypothetical protein